MRFSIHVQVSAPIIYHYEKEHVCINTSMLELLSAEKPYVPIFLIRQGKLDPYMNLKNENMWNSCTNCTKIRYTQLIEYWENYFVINICKISYCYLNQNVNDRENWKQPSVVHIADNQVKKLCNAGSMHT